jgi:hypothetical protein
MQCKCCRETRSPSPSATNQQLATLYQMLDQGEEYYAIPQTAALGKFLLLAWPQM